MLCFGFLPNQIKFNCKQQTTNNSTSKDDPHTTQIEGLLVYCTSVVMDPEPCHFFSRLTRPGPLTTVLDQS